MFKFTCLTACLPLLFLFNPVFGQVCEGDVVLTSQAQVNAFDCETVLGTLLITGPDITSLEPLRGLKMVDEHLILQGLPALASLDGLQDLTEVTCSFEIKDCDLLTDLQGLDNLTSAGRNFTVTQSANIQSLNGLNNFTSAETVQIWENPLLSECCVLSSLLDLVGEKFYMYGNAPGCDITSIQKCDSFTVVCEGDVVLITQDDFDNFNCSRINGNLIIGDRYLKNQDLLTESLKSLREVTGDLVINISTLEQMDFMNLEKIGGVLKLQNILYGGLFSRLKSVRAIEGRGIITGMFPAIEKNVDRVDFSYSVIKNPSFLGSIPSVDTLVLTEVYTSTDLTRNFDFSPSLRKLKNGSTLIVDFITTFEGMEHIDSLNYLMVTRSNITDLSGLRNLKALNGVVFEYVNLPDDYCILYPALSRLAELEKLSWFFNSVTLTGLIEACGESSQECEGDIVIGGGSYDLYTFDCEIIYGNLTITQGVYDLATLQSLKEITGNLIIHNLQYSMIAISDLRSLEKVGGSVIIENNQYLGSIQGLSQLIHIGGDLIVRNNPQLTALGVFGLTHVNNVEITNNPLLNYCCDIDRLIHENFVQGEVTLSGNGNACTLETIAICSENATVCEGDIYLTNQFDADNLTCEMIEGNLILYGPMALKLDSLYSLKEIGKEFKIQQNNISFAGLQNLERVGGIINFSSYNIPTTIGTSFNLDPLVSLRSIGGFQLIIDELKGTLNLTEPMKRINWGYVGEIEDISWIEKVPSIDTIRIEYPRTDRATLSIGTIPDLVSEGGMLIVSGVQNVTVTDSIWNKKKYINQLDIENGTFESLDFLATLNKVNDLKVSGRVTSENICGAYDLLKNGEIGNLIWDMSWIPPGQGSYAPLTIEYIRDTCAPEVVSSLSVYPNPSGEDVVKVSWQERSEGNTIIQVLDNNGREMLRQSMASAEGIREMELQTSNLEPGFYLIRITTNGEVQLRRFIKN